MTETVEGAYDYDMYVFTIQWGNTLCENNPDCQQKIKSIPKNIFTLHGLWPSFNDGRKVDECNKGQEINVNINDEGLRNDMNIYWLSYTSSNQHFWNHEYNKHGFCYTEKYQKTMESFFGTAMGLYKKLSLQQLSRSAFGDVKEKERSYSYEQLESAFRKVLGGYYFDIECKKIGDKSYITEIRFFFNLNFETTKHSAHTDCKNGPIYVEFEQ
jgi:ribonuclease T2